MKLPPAPKHLSAEGRSWWKRINSQWDLDEPSLLILESALGAFDRVREAQKILAKEGITCEDRFGQARAHPAVSVERDAKATMLKALKSLGLDLEPLNDGPGRPTK